MLCSNKEIFINNRNEYEKDLTSQGYKNVTFVFKPPENIEERKVRAENKKIKAKKSKNVLWFLPPYTKKVDGRTSVGKNSSLLSTAVFQDASTVQS